MKFLIVTIEAGGNVPPLLYLVRNLKARGHEVITLSEPCMREAYEEAGSDFIPFSEYFTKTDRKLDIFEDWKSKNNSFDNVILGTADIVVRETQKQIRAIQPDVLIVDVILPTALIAAEAEKVKRVLLFHMPEYLPGPNRPPGAMGLLPGKRFFGKLRDRLLRRLFRMVINKYRGKLNAVRKKVGLAPMKDIVDMFHQADLRIIMASRSFDIPIDPAPANVIYTGPVLDDPDWVEAWENPWPADDKRPLVVVGLSTTFQNQKQAIQNCIDALGSLPVRGLVTAGPTMEEESFSEPENVKVITGASHAAIFPQAACVVTHCGHGTLMRALTNGLPVVCLPMGRDQGDNAAKAAHFGAGIRLSPKASPQKIAAAIKMVLADPAYRKRARSLGDKILADAKRGDIVAELETLAPHRKPVAV